MASAVVVHEPVLVKEVLQGLALKAGAIVLDATVGGGGHAEAILERISPQGRLIGIDRDQDILEYARQRLARFGDQMKLIHGQFGELARLLDAVQVDSVDAVLFDLGVSSYQLEIPQRGFSFLREGPLDMRMDQTDRLTAADILNKASLKDLIDLLRGFGQERWAARIAKAIMKKRPLKTTTQLAHVIRASVPPAARHGRIDAATRTFQALRIAVNQELEVLPVGLEQAIDRLSIGGRIAVMAYHSLEDRIVKMTFRNQAQIGRLKILTRRPVRPAPEETSLNPRSRSACLRIAQREGEGIHLT